MAAVEDDDVRVRERRRDLRRRARCDGRGCRAPRAPAPSPGGTRRRARAASSTSPCVVRSPASSTRSAPQPASANARSSRSRCSSDAWRSPTAATVKTATPGWYPQADSTYRPPGTTSACRTRRARSFPELIETMKKAAAALREADVPFLLGGGLAAWARGGPPTEHDVDLLVRERDVERALAALVASGHAAGAAAGRLAAEGVGRRRARRPDLPPAGGPVDDDYFERATIARSRGAPDARRLDRRRPRRRSCSR